MIEVGVVDVTVTVVEMKDRGPGNEIGVVVVLDILVMVAVAEAMVVALLVLPRGNVIEDLHRQVEDMEVEVEVAVNEIAADGIEGAVVAAEGGRY
jgi:hypothetical protein